MLKASISHGSQAACCLPSLAQKTPASRGFPARTTYNAVPIPRFLRSPSMTLQSTLDGLGSVIVLFIESDFWVMVKPEHKSSVQDHLSEDIALV